MFSKDVRSAGRRTSVVAAWILGSLLSGWIASGVRILHPSTEFAVLERRLATRVRVYEQRRILVVPPGLFRLTVFPRQPAEIKLPGARQAMLPSLDGSRYGFRGTALVRALPARAEDLAAAANGGGLPGVVLSSLRAAATVLANADRDERSVSTRTVAFEQRLREEVARRGAVLESLWLEGFDDLLAEGSAPPIPPDVKVLVVGLDGADWEIVDPLMASGRMPNLLGLVRNGVRAKLLSIAPMLSPVIWTSIATGVEPARHGILDFLATSQAGASEPVNSRARKVPALWEILSDAGASVGVTGWWATWPADPVSGYMITDRVAYQLFGYRSDPRSAAGKTWPASTYETVEPLIVPPDTIPWGEIEAYLDGDRKRAQDFDSDERERLDGFKTLLASGTTYLNIALAMRKHADVRFETVYFEGTDTVGHLFMPFRPPQLPSVDRRLFSSYRSVVDRYYENADRMLGRLLEGRRGWIVIVLSDHGFASDATRPLTSDSRIGHGAAADWHRRFGLLAMSGPGVRRGVRLEKASIYDVAPTVLALFNQPVPLSWPGRVLGTALEPELLESRPVRFRTDDPVRRGARDVPTGDEHDEEARELRAKLQSLGYIAPNASPPMTTKNNRGVGLLAEGKFEEAAAAFREAIADEPGQSTLSVNLGIALRFAGKRREAKELFEKAFAQPDSRRSAGHQLAQLALEDGELQGAEQLLRSVLEHEGGAAEVRNSLGLVLEKRGRVREASREYAQAAKLDANAAEPRNNLGNLARRDRREADAERWYLAAIEADPYFMGAYNNLALLYQDRGQIDKAIDLYGRALAKSPRSAVVLNNLASLYFATGDNREARALWRKAVEADPKYASPLNNLAGMALSEGDDGSASALLDQALALDPGYGDAHINRSLIARRRGDLRAARRELEKAARDPRSAGTAWMQQAFLDLAAGKPAVAVSKLEEARRHLGDRTDLLNALGDAYARVGDRKRALRALKQSLAMDPRQTGVESAIDELEKR